MIPSRWKMEKYVFNYKRFSVNSPYKKQDRDGRSCWEVGTLEGGWFRLSQSPLPLRGTDTCINSPVPPSPPAASASRRPSLPCCTVPHCATTVLSSRLSLRQRRPGINSRGITAISPSTTGIARRACHGGTAKHPAVGALCGRKRLETCFRRNATKGRRDVYLGRGPMACPAPSRLPLALPSSATSTAQT